MGPLLLVVSAVVLLFGFVLCAGFLTVFRPWMKARTSRAPIPVMDLVGMRLRGASVDLVVDAYVGLVQADCPVTVGEVEAVCFRNKGRRLSPEMLAVLVREQKEAAAGASHEENRRLERTTGSC